VLYSSADLDYESYKVYVDGTEVSYNEVAGQKMLSNSKQKTDISSTLFVALMIEIAALIIAIGIAIMLKRSK
jgi:hypothetical protein